MRPYPGLANFFVKTDSEIGYPSIRILTLGLFGLVINILIVWVVDIIFPNLSLRNNASSLDYFNRLGARHIAPPILRKEIKK